MARTQIPINRVCFPLFHTFDARWVLLAAGDFAARDFNVMTISWGSLGVVWGKPFAQVFVRRSRFTYQFMEKAESFTLSVFPEEHRKGLSWCGSHSGRTGDKVSAAGFTPTASLCVPAPGFEEAELLVECRKMYFSDMFPAHFLDPSIQSNYPAPPDYHRVYFGEVVAVSGTPAYMAAD
ncbi:MAG: flavin reductase [Spirochaetia bacterium]|jgi:flavin reductase (DIM6/NTAB) family NADH-FMN oxidoreductase RutF